MAFLLGKDWNVLTATFERADLFRINGNRTKGRDSNKIRDNAKRHGRTIYWAVYDQKGRLIESGPGPYSQSIPQSTLERLMREFPTNEVVLSVLETLESGESDKAAKVFTWNAETEEEAATAATPPVRQAPPPKLYKLVVPSEDGEEFESALRLAEVENRLTGVLVGPDGEEAPIRRARLLGGELSFEVTFGSGEEAVSLKFQGRVLNDTVKGTFV